MQRRFGLIAIGLALLGAPSLAVSQMVQERVDLAVVNRIRAEGLDRSQLPELARYLTEVIGPRLTGSPGMQRANQWTAEKLREWGLDNVVLEPWGEFGRGWERVAYRGRILTPFVQPLHAQPVAWTGSTNGPVTGEAVIVRVDSAADLERFRGKLRGAVVLAQDSIGIEPVSEWRPRRTPLDRLLAPPPEVDPEERARRAVERARMREQMMERFRRQREVRSQMNEMMREEGVAVILTPSSRAFGVLRGGGNSAGRDPDNPEPIPQIVLLQEQYNFIYRNVKAGIPVRLEINVQNRFFDDDLQAYNTLGDIPGTDKADEYVMLGAHLDSWHMGGGATDNAAGSVVMMEAVRILQALGVKPRRTIRIALWSGEEQGLLGSRRWVENHAELHSKISAYVNVDNGTGRVRGIWDQMNEQAIPIFEQILWPFRDLGVVAVRHGNTGGTDHLSFDRAGIPGFNFIQDPIEYGIRTHHTYIDTFDHLVLDDLKQAAVVVAATVYHLAMREEMMPRKTADTATN
ncbi:MAG: M20/M25/M40 family metallo-hydrolase [Gemmatimonadales bacterium]|nr:M20/M25/M40 family metallo-hydrolase [Gemmatimonadales bacterium]NIN10020.1 M20/M25/M40 family metallo-hydrolase [Gemmatimonadales bacterium]NIQ98672.1 M20/M25/M40 family metallo-hydrolase [Gemmatimonadales bacterium]NIS63549.1 M20/M25/M40 family metallo-hydrolase [Gemmatimonadales bacterium]